MLIGPCDLGVILGLIGYGASLAFSPTLFSEVISVDARMHGSEGYRSLKRTRVGDALRGVS